MFGTGFAVSVFLAPMTITGLDGLDLNKARQDGAEAYLGITISGFPNMFILYGPNTNLGNNSIVTCWGARPTTSSTRSGTQALLAAGG